MRYESPTLMCDAEECYNTADDFYSQLVSSVDGVPITEKRRAPGWVSLSSGGDYCPQHVEAKEES